MASSLRLTFRNSYLQACEPASTYNLSPFCRAFSSRWKAQRDADVYADRAIREGMRSRAAYKLEEINRRCDFFLRRGAHVVDLGAAPGGFSMVAAKQIRLDDAINRWNSLSRLNNQTLPEIKRTLGGSQMPRKYGQLTCVDRDDMEPVPGAIFIRGDLREGQTHEKILWALAPYEADVVLSDMAPDTTGEKETNHVRIMELADEAFRIARNVLRNGGTFVCKIFSGADERDFHHSLRQCFAKVRAIRPAPSRKVSPEIYYVAQGFVPQHMQAGEMAEQNSLYRQLAQRFGHYK